MATAICFSYGCASSESFKPENVIAAQQSQPTTTHPSVPADAAFTSPQPAPSDSVEQYYPREDLEHWITGVEDRGARLRLEDGSIWEIANKDRPATMFWQAAERIEVARNVDPEYPFRLTNLGKNAIADARLISSGDQR